jgi:molybdenum cofactor cytidylyltransferase
MSISAIILAAGTSSRMNGVNKLLLPFRGKTVIQTVTENVLNSGASEVIVVTGHQSLRIASLLSRYPVQIVCNDRYNEGPTTSIRAGVSIATGYGYMICQADMPFVTSVEYSLISAFFEEQRKMDPACICVPAFTERMGNPLVFSHRHRGEIMLHSGINACKDLLRSHFAHIRRFETATDGILRDIDTPEDYLASLWQGAMVYNNDREHNMTGRSVIFETA